MARKKGALPAHVQRQVFGQIAAWEGVARPRTILNPIQFTLEGGEVATAFLSTDHAGRFVLYVDRPGCPLRCTDVGQLVLSILQAE